MNELLTECLKITHYDFDPGATTNVDIAWVDFRDFQRFLVSFFRTIGTGATTLRILGNAQSNGGGTDVVVKTKTLTSAEPNAVGDYTFLECTVDEVIAAGKAAGIDVRYLSASVSVATDTDEGVVTYILGGPRYKAGALTSDNIA